MALIVPSAGAAFSGTAFSCGRACQFPQSPAAKVKNRKKTRDLAQFTLGRKLISSNLSPEETAKFGKRALAGNTAVAVLGF
jgi:hypothetical protein